MSNPVRQFAIARENSFFKVEQEADIQRHRKRLISAGEIEVIAGGNFGPRRQQSFQESAATFEVLAEVLQQQARLDDPGAAARQEYERKVRGALPALSEAEMARYKSALYGLAAAVGHVPRMSLGGRNRYGAVAEAAAIARAQAPPLMQAEQMWTPAQKDAARRAYMAGARSLLYGSALGLGGVLLLGSFTIRALDVADPAEFKARMQALADPVALSAQETLLPLKGQIQGALASWFGLQPGEAGAGPEDSEFSASLRRRLQRRMGAGSGGSLADVLPERGQSSLGADASAAAAHARC